MKRLAKYISVVLAMIIVIGLCSCKPDEGEPNDNTHINVDENVIYSPNVETSLVLGEGLGSDSVRLIKNAYLKQTGKNIKITSYDTAQNAHEIIIGETEREISKKAYRYLELMQRESEHVGYVIYSDGKSVAIAFDDVEYGVRAALTEAVELFVSDYMTAPSLKCDSGILTKRAFDSFEWQIKRDEESLEAIWKLKNDQIFNLVEKNAAFAEEIVKELKTLYELYNKDHKTVVWLANLYDPVSGGFYYSNSARNNEGYLPDLESTADSIGLINAVLIDYRGSLTDYFGEEISARFVSFANSMQASDNGYFYHPQWPRDAVDRNVTRRSRDLMSALSILSNFGAIPKYDTPNGVKGESAWSGVVASSSLVLPLAKNNVMMVAASATDEDELYIPPHLTSESNFKSYLSSLDMEISALDTAKAISAQIPQILFRDGELEKEGSTYRLSDILVNWLNSKQKSSGLWGADKEISIHSLNILYEVVSIYTKLGKGLSNFITLIHRVSDCIVAESKEEINVNDISSAWTVLSAISENMNLFPDNLIAKVALSEIYSKIPSLLESTRLKFVELIKEDGSFMTQTGTKDGMSHGMPIASATADEGNVSATLAAIKNTWYAIFNTLNIGNVPVFMTTDRMMFQKTLLDMGVIIKNEMVPIDPIDFEDAEVGSSTKEATLNLSEATTATVEAGDKEHGNVLNIKSVDSKVNDTVDVRLLLSVKGSTGNIAELDICVLPGTENGAVFRVILYENMYLLTINVSGETVMLHEDSYQYDSSYKHDLGARAKVGEWFNIRIEYYVGTRDTVRTKIFFNGDCIAVSNNFFLKEDASRAPKSEYKCLRLETVKTKDLNILVDNIITESNYQMYVPETNADGKLVRNADAPEGKKTVYNFEEITEGALPSGFVQTGGTAGAASVNGNKKLSISSCVTELTLPLSERGTLTNSVVVEFDAIVSEESEVGSYFTLSFNEYLLNDTNLAGFRFVVVEDSSGKYLTIKECLAGKEGATYDSVHLPLGESFKFRVQVFLNEKLALLTINNAIIGVNSNVAISFAKRYMGEITLSSSEKSATLLVDNLLCERIVGDYKIAVEPPIDRETHSFDTLAGIESSGISLNEGAASFVGAENNSYIRIPVNERAGDGRFGAVFLDVLKTAASERDLIILLTDKIGNKIASFALHATESSVDIYEYTENGRYEKSIYSVKSSDFTLGIEYGIAEGDFNILVDGKYVVSTSITYSHQSGKYRFEQLEISSNGKAPFLVDNVVVETSLDIFTTPIYKTQNKDSSDEVVTYEHSSFANMTTLFNTGYLVTPEAKIKIKESIVKDKVSRVLEYTSGASAQDILLAKRLTKKLEGANAVAFETDLMIAPETSTLRLTITLKPNDGTACTIYVWSRSGKIMISSDLLKNKDTYLDIKDGEWFNIRLEYTDTQYDYDYNGKNDVIVRVYINGDLVASGIKPDNPDNILSASIVNQARLDIQGGSSGKVYLDNTKYEQFKMEYEPPLPPDTHTLTFEPGVINGSVKPSLGRNSSLGVEDTTVAGEVAKVLKLVSADRTNDKLGILVTQSLEGANAISFETDIMILPTTDTAELTLEPLNANGRQPFSLLLTAEKGGEVKLSAKGLPETVIGNSGEWIHLKIEYMNPVLDYNSDGDRDILLKIYVDNARDPIVVYTPYSATSHYDPTRLESFNISVSSSCSAEVLLDNIKYWQIELTLDAGGVPPVEKENESLGGGGDTLDKDGWA